MILLCKISQLKHHNLWRQQCITGFSYEKHNFTSDVFMLQQQNFSPILQNSHYAKNMQMLVQIAQEAKWISNSNQCLVINFYSNWHRKLVGQNALSPTDLPILDVRLFPGNIARNTMDFIRISCSSFCQNYIFREKSKAAQAELKK